MTDDFEIDEPDFDRHLRNVLSDLVEGLVDEETAYAAIKAHPAMKLIPIAPMEVRKH